MMKQELHDGFTPTSAAVVPSSSTLPTPSLLSRKTPSRPSDRPVLDMEAKVFFQGWRLRLYLILAVGLPLVILAHLPWASWLIPLMIAVHAIPIVATFQPNRSWFGHVRTQFRSQGREVWLTIDDGPHAHDTPEMLELLARYRAQATFFVVGSQVRSHPNLAKSIVDQGHELANHTHTHPVNWFWCAPPWMIATQMERANLAIQAATGRRPRWFRSPLGASNYFVHALLRRCDLKILGWSARGYDGLKKDPKRIVDCILRQVRPGAIVLLHEGKRDHHGNATNVRVLEILLRRLTDRGYTCVVPESDRVY